MKNGGWLDMKEVVMTPRKNYDPRDSDYVRRVEAIGGDIWAWVLATGAAVLFGFLLLANYSGTTNTESSTASNNPPDATSNSPPRIPASTTGSGARPEQPTPVIHGGPSR
jgi:hypothetical protein